MNQNLVIFLIGVALFTTYPYFLVHIIATSPIQASYGYEFSIRRGWMTTLLEHPPELIYYIILSAGTCLPLHSNLTA